MTEKKWGPHEDRSKDWYSKHHAEPGFKKERAKRAKFDRQRHKDENIELNSRFSKLKVKARFLKAELEDYKAKYQKAKQQLNIHKTALKALHPTKIPSDDSEPPMPHQPPSPPPHDWKDNAFIHRCQQKEATCISAVNYSWKEFEALEEEFHDDIAKTTFEGLPEQCNDTHRDSKWPIDFMMFVTLLWCCTGMKEGLIAAIFAETNLHQRDIRRFVRRVLPAMKERLNPDIQWPTDDYFQFLAEGFELFHIPDLQNVVCAIDGTETKVTRTTDQRAASQQYSVKKKIQGACWSIVVLLNGVVVWLSSASWDHNDQTTWNKEHLRERFQQKPWGIVGDAIYTFNPVSFLAKGSYIFGFSPNKRESKTLSLDPGKAAYNKALSRTRVVVENSFHRLKKWGVLKQLPSKGSNAEKLLMLDMILAVCVPLTNRQIKASSCRAATWLHQHYRPQGIAQPPQ